MKDASKKLLEKAGRSIHAAELLLSDGEADFAAGRIYYAMFYIAQALLYEQGFRRFSKHGEVHAAFGKAFAKTKKLPPKFHRWLIDAFDKRIRGDYDVDSDIDVEDVEKMLGQARDFLKTATQYLAKNSE